MHEIVRVQSQILEFPVMPERLKLEAHYSYPGELTAEPRVLYRDIGSQKLHHRPIKSILQQKGQSEYRVPSTSTGQYTMH